MTQIMQQYSLSFLATTGAQYLSQGLNFARLMLFKDIFINFLNVDMDLMLVYTTIFTIPSLCKIFWGIIIDARLIQYRRNYFIVFGVIATLAQIIIGLSVAGPKEATALIFILNVC